MFEDLFKKDPLTADFSRTELAQYWLTHQDEAMKEIPDLLSRIPNGELLHHRSELLKFVRLLPEKRDDLKQLSQREIEETVVRQSFIRVNQSEVSYSPLLPYISQVFEGLLLTASTKEEAIDMTLNAVQRQADPLVRSNLISHFATKYPESMPEIQDAIKKRGIDDVESSLAKMFEY